jgi:hypothetical protein
MDVTRDPHKTAYSVREQMHEESTECTSTPSTQFCRIATGFEWLEYTQ